MIPDITKLASGIAESGIRFNDHLQTQYAEDWGIIDITRLQDVRTVPDEHLLFYMSIAESLSWLQDSKDRGLVREFLQQYLHILLSSRNQVTPGDLRRQIEDRLRIVPLPEISGEATSHRPKRLSAVVSALETWSQVRLPTVQEGQDLNVEEVQRLAIEVNGVRWSSLAAVKMYTILKGQRVVGRSIYPPMGRAVSKGIEKLFGFSLGESRSDHEHSRGLHLRFAELTGATVFDLNSGFFVAGGGS